MIDLDAFRERARITRSQLDRGILPELGGVIRGTLRDLDAALTECAVLRDQLAQAEEAIREEYPQRPWPVTT